MFDNRKVATLAENIGNFVKSYPDIYLIFEETSADIFPLLHRVKANVKAILVEAISTPQKIFNVPVLNFSQAVPNFNAQTAVIKITKKFSNSPLKEISFQNATLKITVPLLEFSVDEVPTVFTNAYQYDITTAQMYRKFYPNIYCKKVRFKASNTFKVTQMLSLF